MNARDDEAWLDSLLQRQLPSVLSDEGFREQLLQRLPPRERPWLRVPLLGVTWWVGLAALLLPSSEAMVASVQAGSLLVPSSLGAALLWYLGDCLS
jgi:hypothetical protein